MAYISKHGFHYAMRARRSTLFNGMPLKNYSLTSDIKDMGFGKYSNEQKIERLFGLLCVYSLTYMVMYKEEKHVFKEPGISFYRHFKTTMKDKVARAVFLSELAALRKVSRRKIN